MTARVSVSASPVRGAIPIIGRVGKHRQDERGTDRRSSHEVQSRGVQIGVHHASSAVSTTPPVLELGRNTDSWTPSTYFTAATPPYPLESVI
jgi:hypothetical protein